MVTYFELSKLIDFLKIKILKLDINLSDDFIPWVGLFCAGIKREDILGYKCRSSHYLKDALRVKELPSAQLLTEEVNVGNLEKICDSIRGTQQIPIHSKNFCGSNFREALMYVASLTLSVAEELGIIKGADKYFTPSHKDKLTEEGYVVIPSVLSEEQVQTLSELTLFIAQKEDEENVSYRYGDQEHRLQRVYNLISKHPVYLELLDLPIVKEVLEFYFAKDNLHHKYVLSSFQSNIIHPGGEDQQLHVDGMGYPMEPPSWPTRLNLNFLLTDWTVDNGATLLFPGSHKLYKSPAPNEILDKDLLTVCASRGSLVVWGGHTWHKSGKNNSKESRFGLFSCFSSSHVKELCTEEEHLEVVDAAVVEKLSPEWRFMLGYDRGVKRGAMHRVDYTNTKFKNISLNE